MDQLPLDQDLQAYAEKALRSIGEDVIAQRMTIYWNRRMRTTAGRALLQTYEVQMNPKIAQFGAAEVWQTVLHELAHLVAWHRYQHRGHGTPWKAACAELGIPNESVTHDLPLQRRTQRKNWRYKCPHCGLSFDRARRAKPNSACAECCKQHNGGKFTKKFLLEEYKLVYQ